MTQYRGIATIEDDQFPLTVSLDDDKLSLVSGEVSVGEWPAGAYLVIDLGEGTFIIEAEESSIPFQPDDPGDFARGLSGETSTGTDEEVGPIVVAESPPPKPATVAAFYTLVLVTVALGVWAFISLV